MIKIKNVTKRYGDMVVLEDASYTFPETGVVCLLGASGGGKTTLLNLLAGFDTDYEGEILVGGTAINQLDGDALCRYRKDNIGFVFQNYHLLPGYTVLENIMLAGELSQDPPERCHQKAVALLTRLGIAEKGNQKVEHLSGGQKQRAAIARALMGDPQILLADEPTGALDRATSTEIMGLLREIAQDRLVVMITHDQKICAFADEIIHIQDQKIIPEQSAVREEQHETALIQNAPIKVSVLTRGAKNFKVHWKRYIAVSLAISIGILAFLCSLSFGNVMDQSIEAFQQKNTAFNNGYIRGADDGTILAYLKNDDRIENVYYQYKLGETLLSVESHTERLPEKFPTPKATEGLSYGVMPRRGMNEIAITPSLAKKFDSDIKNLLGKTLSLEYNQQRYDLAISGIYNAGYDDFFVSSDVEQQFYGDLAGERNVSISYDVKAFSDVVAVSNGLQLRGLDVKNAADEVYALQKAFHSLQKLFLVISVLILMIGLFICTILLIKLQNTRYHEVGLLSALGYSRRQISGMISAENGFLSVLAMAVSLILFGGNALLSSLLHLPLVITGQQIGLSALATCAAMMVLSGVASSRLIRIEPAEALRK